MPKFPAMAHVALTVSDLDRSRRWYQRLFGSDPVLDRGWLCPFHQVVWSGSGALVAINWFPDLHSSEPFDDRRPGLDHVAFACSSRYELEAWERRLNEIGRPEWRGQSDASYGSVLSFRDPDNIALGVLFPGLDGPPGESVHRRSQSAAAGQSNGRELGQRGRAQKRAHSDTAPPPPRSERIGREDVGMADRDIHQVVEGGGYVQLAEVWSGLGEKRLTVSLSEQCVVGQCPRWWCRRFGTTGAKGSHGCIRSHDADLAQLRPVPAGTLIDTVG